MRSLITAIVCLAILLGMWFTFDAYSEKTIHSYNKAIDAQIMSDIENENWDRAQSSFNDMSRKWHNYKKKAYFYLDTQAVNDVDYTFARAKYYIKAKDVSNASGEVACLKEQLSFLHFNENVSFYNIF